MSTPPRTIASLERVAKGFGAGPVLDDVTVGIAVGERVGIVGRNGGGKTTLLRLLARAQEPDDGRVVHESGLRVGLLAQADDLDAEATVRHELVGDRPEHEWAGDRRIRDVLEGLLGGVRGARFPDGLATRIAPLSGGERRRIALARLLLETPDLLLLDEPTNHLDVEGVDWLARHLAARRGALAVVTHDRWFLDAVCQRTWEIADGRVHVYDGAYAAWVLARAERERLAAVADERRRNLLRKELAWLRRGPPARTSKPRFRIDAANALIDEEPEPRDRVELLRFASTRLGTSVLDAEDLGLALGERQLLRRFTWRIGPGDRLGLVGVNGSGKTTVLRLLAGEAEPDSGVVKRGSTVRLAFLQQELEDLDGSQRVLESLQSVRARIALADGRELTAGQLCERFGFTGNKQWTFVRELSGGERRRLQLMRLLMAEPNVLLLDEPTNDLDTDTLAALEDLLDGFAGSIVVVSHDRYLIERVCDDVHALTGDGRLRHLPAGIEQYLAERRAEEEEAVARAVPAAARPAQRGPALRQARKDSERLERELERLAARESELHVALAAHATDYGRVAELDAELRALAAARAAAEAAWLEAAEALEG